MQSDIFEDALTDVSSVQLYRLGTLRQDRDGKLYRYVQNVDTTTADGWTLVAGTTADQHIVSGRRSGGHAINTVPRGVAISAIPTTGYGWVLISGYKANILAGSAINAGQALHAHASTNGAAAAAAGGTTAVITVHQLFGLAIANGTTTRVKATIRTL